MSADINITVRAIWRWQEATGTKCSVCGAPTFLKELVLVRQIDNQVPEEVGFTACQSCGDCVLNRE